MPQRPDLRDIATNVRDALADCDRDALLDMLTFVLKEYVVEGPPPMLMHQAETIADLQGLSFAQLMTALQTRLEVPELAMFAVDGEQVSVRVGGVMHPIQALRTAPAAELPRPSAGVRIVEAPTTEIRQMAPAVSAPPPAERGAPRPVAGLSVRGRPAGTMAGVESGPPPAAAPAAAEAPAASAAAPAAPAKKDKDGEDGDDASARFSLLELD